MTLLPTKPCLPNLLFKITAQTALHQFPGLDYLSFTGSQRGPLEDDAEMCLGFLWAFPNSPFYVPLDQC